MKCPNKAISILGVLSLAVLLGAGQVAERGAVPSRKGDRNPDSGTEPITGTRVSGEELPQTAETAAPNFNLDWWSVNSGGATEVTGTNYGLGLSVGQVAAGHVSGTNYNLGVGFWYGAAPGDCPMVIFGDVDLGGTVTSGDIIYLVNFVFKGGPIPQPCEAAGDVDCGGSVTSGDIIYLVNFVFKGGPPPCNTCTSPLAGAC